MILMRIVRLEPKKGELEAGILEEVLTHLREGGLVVYPTDTLYALGADPYNKEAVRKLYKLKKRPVHMPVSIAVASLEEVKRLSKISREALSIYERYLPGPITILVRKGKEAPPPPVSSANLIGIRVPGHPIALLLAKEFGPITSTSANLHGRIAPSNVETAIQQLGKEVSIYLDCGPCFYGRESTVVDVSGREGRVIREGALPKERLGIHGR